MEPTTGKAKYYTLMEALKEQILSGTIKPGQKLPSENELTREYALSRHTVRKALALLENEGYITARHGKGTFCSERVIQRHNSKNIAVTTTYLSDYIFPRLIQGMDRVLSENGYSIILKNTCNSRSKEEKVLKELLDKPIDGLIIEPSKSQILCRHINLYEMLDKYQIPYVFIQGSHLSLFCLLMTVVNILNSKFMMQQQDTGANPQMAAMKWMTYLMPIMMLFILNSYPSGLNYYYFISTLISVVTTLILRKTTNEEKLLAQLEARKKDPKKAKKTGFAARLEAMQKQQEQLLKERQNKK